jgi:hypothetical protein
MPYTAEISRSSPTAFIFLVDQSGSMNDKMASGRTKAQFVADALNRTLATLITRCTKASGTWDYFHVGVIAYGGSGVGNGFHGELGTSILNPLSQIEAHPLRQENRKKRTDDGAGGVVEQDIRFTIWFDPKAEAGTPMREALTKAAEELAAWCDTHSTCYPPTVLHITDGESTDGDPEELAGHLRQLSTSDGQVLLLNIHVSTSGSDPIKFPSSESTLPDAYAKLLFRMSSLLPPTLIQYAQEKGHKVSPESRGFMFNAEAPELVEFFDIGTRASQLR